MAYRFVHWTRRHSGKIAIGIGVTSVVLWELSHKQVSLNDKVISHKYNLEPYLLLHFHVPFWLSHILTYFSYAQASLPYLFFLCASFCLAI